MHVDRRDLERVGGQVTRVDLRRGKCVREQNRQATRAGADIDHAPHVGAAIRGWQERDELVGDEFEEVAARDDHALVDVDRGTARDAPR